jgi:hypothetical protein
MAFIRQVLIKLLLCCDRGRINRAVGVTGRAYLLAGGGLGGGRGVLGFRLHRRHPLLHVQFALLDPEISPRDQLTACWCGYINIIWRARLKLRLVESFLGACVVARQTACRLRVPLCHQSPDAWRCT